MIKKLYDDFKVLPLENRILIISAAGGIVLSLVSSMINILLNLGQTLTSVTIVTSLVATCVLYFAFVRKSVKLPAYLALLSLILVFHPLIWFNNAGSYGPTLLFINVNGIFVAAMMQHLNYRLIIVLQLISVYALLAIGHLRPELVTPYPSDISRLFDHGFSITIIFLLSFLIVAKIVQEYNQNIQALEKAHLDLQLVNEKLTKASETDELTAIYNRRYVMNQIKHLLETQRSFSLLMLDIDRFKTINDNYGHGVGDEVIRQVSKSIVATMPSDSIVSRIGGEEFLIVLSTNSLKIATEYGSDLMDALTSTDWPIAELNVTISGGIYPVDPNETFDFALDEVDKRLYEAKNSGRNRLVGYK